MFIVRNFGAIEFSWWIRVCLDLHSLRIIIIIEEKD